MNIILKNKDGNVAIMTLAPGADKNEAIKKFNEFHPDYCEAGENLLVPNSRQFRDAWTLKGNKVVVDVNKAAEIHLRHIRHLRDKKLAILDREQLRHIRNADKLEEIEQEKQLLRDLPQNYKFDIKNPDIPGTLI